MGWVINNHRSRGRSSDVTSGSGRLDGSSSEPKNSEGRGLFSMGGGCDVDTHRAGVVIGPMRGGLHGGPSEMNRWSVTPRKKAAQGMIPQRGLAWPQMSGKGFSRRAFALQRTAVGTPPSISRRSTSPGLRLHTPQDTSDNAIRTLDGAPCSSHWAGDSPAVTKGRCRPG